MILHIPSGGGDTTFSGTGTAGFSSKTGFFGTSGTLKILVSFTSGQLKGHEIYTTSSSNNLRSKNKMLRKANDLFLDPHSREENKAS